MKSVFTFWGGRCGKRGQIGTGATVFAGRYPGFCLENILSNTESEDVMLERVSLRQAIESLSEREGMVIKLRFFHGLTQERVSKVLSVSQVQVSRIEKKALCRLREFLN